MKKLRLPALLRGDGCRVMTAYVKECAKFPIDACYRLVGLIRISWKGLSGGEEVWKAIAEFFADLRAKSQPVRGEPDAGPEL